MTCTTAAVGIGRRPKMASEIKLKPCPFCGGKAEMVSDFEDEHYVYCTGCKGGWKTMENPEEAAAAWNRRCEDGD
jgi:Lar family restriction alleviation protein